MFVLLVIHILSGASALVSAAVALYSAKGKRTHTLSGRIYFWSMVAIFLTAIPMSIASSNVFLFLIAIFSFYLAFAGMRFAKNLNGVPTRSDWLAVLSMIFSGIGMRPYAAFFFWLKRTPSPWCLFFLLFERFPMAMQTTKVIKMLRRLENKDLLRT